MVFPKYGWFFFQFSITPQKLPNGIQLFGRECKGVFTTVLCYPLMFYNSFTYLQAPLFLFLFLTCFFLIKPCLSLSITSAIRSRRFLILCSTDWVLKSKGTAMLVREMYTAFQGEEEPVWWRHPWILRTRCSSSSLHFTDALPPLPICLSWELSPLSVEMGCVTCAEHSAIVMQTWVNCWTGLNQSGLRSLSSPKARGWFNRGDIRDQEDLAGICTLLPSNLNLTCQLALPFQMSTLRPSTCELRVCTPSIHTAHEHVVYGNWPQLTHQIYSPVKPPGFVPNQTQIFWCLSVRFLLANTSSCC